MNTKFRISWRLAWSSQILTITVLARCKHKATEIGTEVAARCYNVPSSLLYLTKIEVAE